MQMRMLCHADESSFLAAIDAMHADDPPWGFAFQHDPAMPFGEYVDWINGWSRGERLPDGWLPNSFFVAVVDGEIVGRLSLRHAVEGRLAEVGGHVGYGVLPAHRRRGYATAMLRWSLPRAAAVGLGEVLLTCDEHNHGSRRVIEGCGGRYERSTEGKRRYWISTAEPRPGRRL